MTLIDTAEMYGNGRSERLIADALDGTSAAGGPLREGDGSRAATLDREGLFIVSKVLPHNAGRPDIFESCDNTLDNLGVDYLDLYLLPWMRDHGVSLMAYCPLAQAGALRGRLFESPALAEVARRHGATVPQVVLAWDVRGGDTIAIPRSSRPGHTLENAAADAIELTEEDLALISRDFPPRPPTRCRSTWSDPPFAVSGTGLPRVGAAGRPVGRCARADGRRQPYNAASTRTESEEEQCPRTVGPP